MAGFGRVRMPSTRWQRWGGSDTSFKTFDQAEKGKHDKELGGGSGLAPLKGGMAETGSVSAPAGKRQYLKSGKYVMKSMDQKYRSM